MHMCVCECMREREREREREERENFVKFSVNLRKHELVEHTFARLDPPTSTQD